MDMRFDSHWRWYDGVELFLSFAIRNAPRAAQRSRLATEPMVVACLSRKSF